MSEPAPPPAIILDQPQLAENIGAAARVMANFGLEDLRLVRPRDGWPQPRAWASASGADWPLDGARVFASVEEAIADLQVVHAATARPRETLLPVLTPREGAMQMAGAMAAGVRTGLLFGAERAGLETRDIALCEAIVTIPIDPRFHSLNLAQAVAVNAYEWRLASLETPPPTRFAQDAPLADKAMMQGVFEHLDTELEYSGFFHPPEKKPAVVRNLRVMLNRAAMSQQEARTFRGVITALTRGRGRTLAKLAANPDERDAGQRVARTPSAADGDV